MVIKNWLYNILLFLNILTYIFGVNVTFNKEVTDSSMNWPLNLFIKLILNHYMKLIKKLILLLMDKM